MPFWLHDHWSIAWIRPLSLRTRWAIVGVLVGTCVLIWYVVGYRSFIMHYEQQTVELEQAWTDYEYHQQHVQHEEQAQRAQQRHEQVEAIAVQRHDALSLENIVPSLEAAFEQKGLTCDAFVVRPLTDALQQARTLSVEVKLKGSFFQVVDLFEYLDTHYADALQILTCRLSRCEPTLICVELSIGFVSKKEAA